MMVVVDVNVFHASRSHAGRYVFGCFNTDKIYFRPVEE